MRDKVKQSVHVFGQLLHMTLFIAMLAIMEKHRHEGSGAARGRPWGEAIPLQSN